MSWTTAQDDQNMVGQLGVTALRPGPSGNENAPNHANYDEAGANPFPLLPDPLMLKNGRKVTTPEMWWKERRPVLARQFVGHVDNLSSPLVSVDIKMTLVTPSDAHGPVPIMIMFGRSGLPQSPDPVTPAPPGVASSDPPATEQLITAGWGNASLVPGSIQADNGAGLTKGIIGLVNSGQPPSGWGSLRAWAWGAYRALDCLGTDKAERFIGRAQAGELKQASSAVPAMPPADRPVPRSDENSLLAHKQLLMKAATGRIDIFFVGDSITRRWGATDYPELLANWTRNFFGWNAANFGWGGDTIQNILWRLHNGELDGVNPKVIVLLAGTNNVGKANPPENDDARVADITRGIESAVRLMRSNRGCLVQLGTGRDRAGGLAAFRQGPPSCRVEPRRLLLVCAVPLVRGALAAQGR